ncbi:MAG TPA: septum formation initiator family protein [Acidobacteriaceae bacterium]|nr:septum formation initiator family protein [Acidobacteriaceae bacterium]
MNLGSRKKLQRQLISHDVPTFVSASVPQGSRISRLSASLLGMRRKAATVMFVALSVFLGFYAIFGHDGLVAYQQKQHEAQQLHQQILDLQQQNDRLALHDQRLKTDRDTIEYEAREQMHYTRPGEVIYTLPQAPSATPTPKAK